MARTPILFNRAVEVPAGQERRETIILTNNSPAEERFELSILDGEGPVMGSEPVVAAVNVEARLEAELTLRHSMPAGTPPGIHPFTVVARLRARDLTLRIPGVMTVPAVGGWRADVEPPQALVVKGKEGEVARGEAADPELRPWHKEAVGHVTVTNHSSDWLYCTIELEGENKHWDYRLASQRISLPPWSGARAAQSERAGDFTDALDAGWKGSAERDTSAPATTAPAPEVRIPLAMRPKKRQWFGKTPEGAGKSNLLVKMTRINPGTGAAEAAVERPLRVTYVPLRHPFELIKPAIQKVGAFIQFAISKQGILSLAGLAAFLFTFVMGPANVYYKVREGIWTPKFDEDLVKHTPDKTLFDDGENVTIEYSVANADIVEFSGLPEGAVTETGASVENGKAPASGNGKVSFRLTGRKEDYRITLRAYQVRSNLWIWEPRSKIGKDTHSKHVFAFKVQQKPKPMPRVVGQPFEDAKKTLEGLGFVVQDELVDSPSSPEGTVMKQDQPKGKMLAPGSTVTLAVSKGSTVKAPSAGENIGKPVADVKAALEKAGCTVAVEKKSDPNQPDGAVIGQEPQEPKPGDKVTLTVNRKGGSGGGGIIDPPVEPVQELPMSPTPLVIYGTEDGKLLADQIAAALGGAQKVSVSPADGAAAELQNARFPLVILAPDVEDAAGLLQGHSGKVLAMGRNGLDYLSQADASHRWRAAGRFAVQDVEIRGEGVTLYKSPVAASGASAAKITPVISEGGSVLAGGAGRFWYWAMEVNGRFANEGSTEFKKLVNRALGAR